MKPLQISGIGCCLVDYLYTPVAFSGDGFNQLLSKKPGDGGLKPGKLVFLDDLILYSQKQFPEIKNLLNLPENPKDKNIGGPSIVSLIHASQMCHDLNVNFNFYGITGDDEPGNFIKNKLNEMPSLSASFYKSNKRTPFTYVLSDPTYNQNNGERIFVNNIGAAEDINLSHLPDVFFDSDIIALGGTALLPQLHLQLHDVLKKAKDKNALTIVNTVFDFVNEKKSPGKPWPIGKGPQTYQLIDLLICDMEEALKMSGKSNVDDAISYFRNQQLKAIIITHGNEDLVAYSEGVKFEYMPVKKFPVSKQVAFDIKNNPTLLGDTTGCGDNFAGGVIAACAKQLHDKKNLNLTNGIITGIASGAFACYYLGGMYHEKNAGEKQTKVGKLISAYREELKAYGN